MSLPTLTADISYQIAPLFTLCDEVRRPNANGRERNLLSLSYGNIVRKDIEAADGLLPATFDGYNIVESGDTVLRLTDLQNDQRSLRTGLVRERGIITSAYLTLRPRRSVDPRYLSYALYSLDANKVFYGLGGGLRQSIGFDDLRRLNVPAPLLETQRRIADFLDDQTTRIDNIIAARELQVSLVDDRQACALQVAFSDLGLDLPQSLHEPFDDLPPGFRIAELAHVLRQLTNGYVGPTRDILFDDGVPYIQSLHIKKGQIDFELHPYYVAPEWHRARPRVHLREGDVLIVQTGAIGQIAVVPPGFGEASCHALQIARVEPSVLSGRYLGEYLRSPFAQAHLLARATGALHPHLEGGIKSTPVVIPPPKVQELILNKVAVVRSEATATSSALSASIALLQEFKRSLISAAVSGEFDVSTASGRGVPA